MAEPSVVLASIGERLITGAELYALGDIGPCELVVGRIVRRSFATVQHGAVLANLGCQVGTFVESHALGDVMIGGVGIYTGRDPDTVRGADLLYLSNGRAGQLADRSGYLSSAPDLVIEVVAPDDTRAEVFAKIGEYLDSGVMAVGVVLLDQACVCIYRSIADVQVFGATDRVVLPDVLPGFEVGVEEIFE